MIFPILAAAAAVGAVSHIIKGISSANARNSQLEANDHALSVEEDHNKAVAQQARLAVMGGAFVSGTFNNYIDQQLHFSNAGLEAKRKNLAAQARANRWAEVASVVGAVGQAVGSYQASALKLKDAAASVTALKHISNSLSATVDATQPISQSLENLASEAGDGMKSYLGRMKENVEEGMKHMESDVKMIAPEAKAEVGDLDAAIHGKPQAAILDIVGKEMSGLGKTALLGL